MQRKKMLKLVESYAAASDFPVDHYHLYDHKFKYADEIDNDFPSFYAQLVDVSEFIHFSFQQRILPKSTFIELLNKLEFPILVFRNGTADLTPILIKPQKGKGLDLTDFSGEVESEVHSDNAAELVYQLKSVKDLIENHGLVWEENDLEKDSEQILFLTGYKITSPLSEEEELAPKPVKRLFRLLKSEKKDIYTLYFFAIMIALVNLSLPLGIQAIVGLMSGGLLLESVFVLMILVIVATMVSGWLQVQQLAIVEVLQQRIFTKTAFDFAFRIPKLKLEYIRNQYTPELVNRFFDVLTVQKSLPKLLIDFCSAFVQIIFGLLMLSFYHPYFIFFGVIVIAVIFLVFYFTGKKGLETSIYESKYKYKVVYWLEELGRSMQSFKMSGISHLPLLKMDKLLEKYISYRKKHFKILVWQFSAIIAFKTLITAGLLILGGTLVFQEKINLGQFVASEIIIVLVINSVEKLIGTISVVYDMLTALDKIGQVTDLQIEHNAGREISDIGLPQQFQLELKYLSYRYPEAMSPSFSEVNLSIGKGEKICITGYSDAGKTTLMKTIAGMHLDYTGQMTLNGISVRELNINSYRNMIGNNLKLSDVFEGTIEENISMGNPGILLKEILQAVDQAGLTSFIAGLEKGLQTLVQPAGENLPANIVKKILLARSFVKSSQLILVDEFFHQVKSNDKMALINSLFEGSYSLIIVSSVPEIMRRCDKIVVLKEGRMIDEGSFELLASRNSLPFVNES